MIALADIGKDFPGVRALTGVSLTIAPGEVLGLVGENGAGKSTLIKILGGAYPAGSFRGEVRVGGAARAFRSPRDARRAGIAVVHQELSLVPAMSVADNLLLGRERARFGVVDAAATEATARAILRRVAGHELADAIDVGAAAGTLGVGVQQVVELARALGDDDTPARLIVLDEPTAALTAAERARLFQLVRDRRAAGASFVYISHHLDEILALTDRVAVLRDGTLVATRRTAETCADEVVELMTGKVAPSAPSFDVGLAAARPRSGRTEKETGLGHEDTAQPPVLEVRNLTVRHPVLGDRNVVEDVSFAVRAGEVVALAGAMGAGRTATLSALFGLARSAVSGTVVVAGQAVHIREPRDAIAAGLALVPEDRKGAGLVLGLGVGDNLGLAALERDARWGLVDAARAERAAADRVKDLRIKAPGLGAEVATLSGGNQQKVVIGKWLALAPRVLLLDEPTRGVDVGAKEEIYRLIEALTGLGHAVVMASSDLPEIVRLADRVLVLRDGRLAGELAGGDATGLAIMRLALATAAPAHRSELAS